MPDHITRASDTTHSDKIDVVIDLTEAKVPGSARQLPWWAQRAEPVWQWFTYGLAAASLLLVVYASGSPQLNGDAHTPRAEAPAARS